MSDGAGRPTADEYLGRVLELDPVEDLPQLLRLRVERRGTDARARPADLRPREDLLVDLGSLECDFWAMQGPDLLARLQELERAAPPDLRRRVARLARVARLRPDVVAELARPDVAPVFARMLEQVLVAPTQARAATMSRMEAALDRPETALEVLRSASLLGRRAPQVWDLEAEWLAGLRAEALRRNSRLRLWWAGTSWGRGARFGALEVAMVLTLLVYLLVSLALGGLAVGVGTPT